MNKLKTSLSGAVCAAPLLIAFIGILPVAAQEGAAARAKSSVARAIAPVLGKTDKRLQEVATFEHQVTGVAVTEDGRIFVNFPRWSEDVPVSVAEVMKDGTVKAYPDADWNSWRNTRMGEVTAKDHFVCVQSVVADGKGSLWVVDPAAPNTEKTVETGPKLVQIDLASNSVKRVYAMPQDVAGPASYLNDVRIAPDGHFAYLTDSGVPGGIVVVELSSGKAWRSLSGDTSTKMDSDVKVETDGKPLKRADGRQPMFNADGIALSADGKTLYWQALTGKTLYSIATETLQQTTSDANAVAETVKTVATTEPVDGLWLDKDSGAIYLSAIGENAVKRLTLPGGKIETVLSDARLRWPDTFSQGSDGAIYITASHIQDSPWFHASWTDKHFTLFRFKP